MTVSAESSIPQSRLKQLNDRPVRPGRYVLYWMQQSQRAEENHALEFAIERANQCGVGVVVIFGLTADYPEANRRHYTFMLEGLQDSVEALARRGIPMVVRVGNPPEVALSLADDACILVCDRGYLRNQKAWRREVAERSPCAVCQVESDVVVPVEVTSGKAEYAARTIRPRIHREWDRYLVEFESIALENPVSSPADGLDLRDIDRAAGQLGLSADLPAVGAWFRGGTCEAKRRYDEFLGEKLTRYSEHRNQPQTDDVSGMSPYLHFGQVSPLYLAIEARRRLAVAPRDVETLLEELIVRRELAVNFVEYTHDYDSFECLPSWARTTLGKHESDRRPHLYSREELVSARTHDPYWNAAMMEMVQTGFMHNYMRMYWGKKLLEWSSSPQEAYRTALTLNNRYFLDGRDANSFAGVGWVFGLHDRPWAERSIFGTIRYMAASGLERKCDIQAYVEKIDRLVD